MVERVGLVGKLSDEHVESAVMIVIAPSHAHRSLRLACPTECDPGEHANIGESSVMIVVVQVIGRGIIG